jgi:hypothetical protein
MQLAGDRTGVGAAVPDDQDGGVEGGSPPQQVVDAADSG